MVVTDWIKPAQMTADHPKPSLPFTKWMWEKPSSTVRTRTGMLKWRRRRKSKDGTMTKAANSQNGTGACSGSSCRTTSPIWASSTLCLRSSTWPSTLSSRHCPCHVTVWMHRPSFPQRRRPSNAGQSSSRPWRTPPPASQWPASPQKMLHLHRGSGPSWNWKHITDCTKGSLQESSHPLFELWTSLHEVSLNLLLFIYQKMNALSFWHDHLSGLCRTLHCVSAETGCHACWYFCMFDC